VGNFLQKLLQICKKFVTFVLERKNITELFSVKKNEGMNMKRKIQTLALMLTLFMFAGLQVFAAKKSSGGNGYVAQIAQAKAVNASSATYTAALSKVPASDDGIAYLYELAPYEYAIAPGKAAVATAPLAANVSFTFDLNHKKDNTRLYSKFALGVLSGGQVKMIAEPQYISNPEVLATNTKGRSGHGKKQTQANNFTNLNLTGSKSFWCSGINTTVQIMNNGQNQGLTNPYARAAMVPTDTHPVVPRYYMLNAADATGVKQLADELTYYAANSKGEDWIIGNEVNVRTWNYMVWTDWDTYMREYAQVFRVAYNAIKSTNANARVYVCLDQNWDRNRTPGNAEYYEYIDGKDFLTKFNSLVAGSGNIDWGVAQHPYPVPLTNAKFWDMSGVNGGAYCAQQVKSGAMMSFQNVSMLTNFLMTPQMLAPNGAPRHVIISEVGLTNAQGNDVQAAALMASWVALSRNPLIDNVIYLLAYSEPMVDTRLSGKSQEVFNSMDSNPAAYEEWAKSVIGITDWSQVIK